MNLTSPTIIKEILLRYGAKASKGLGQNFLIDKNILDKIIKSADIKSGDVILEVGPGLGTLTQELAKKAKRVIAIEKDKMMIEILKETLKDFKNVEIIQQDILEIKSEIPKKYKLVANIPYYLTSPLIRKFLERPEGYPNSPQEIILMIQKEVAQRICKNPPDMNLLAVSVQFYAEPKIISYVSKNSFWPAPKIDSAIIKITPSSRNSASQKFLATSQKKYEIEPNLFFEVVKAGFSQPRKQLVNNLTSLKFSNGVKLDKVKIYKWLLENNINPNQRSETLSISDWIGLAKSFKK